MKIWFQNRRTKWKKQENVASEQTSEVVKKGDTDNVSDKKTNVDNINTVHLSSKAERNAQTNDNLETMKNTEDIYPVTGPSQMPGNESND